MGDKRCYAAVALEADLNNNHHLRAASEEAERRMRKRYSRAVAILVLLEDLIYRRGGCSPSVLR